MHAFILDTSVEKFLETDKWRHKKLCELTLKCESYPHSC